MSEPQPRRAKHLMDPTKPRPAATAEDLARLQRVQRWVMSSLVGTTILHLAAGLILAALLVPEGDTVPRVGLVVLAGGFGACAVGSFLAIHGRSLASPWLGVGLLVPIAIGLPVVL